MIPLDNRSLTQEIDRLVDGELSAEDRQNLLKRLDNESDAWRRCALAFLEDQAFRESLKEFAKASPLPVPLATAQPRGRLLDHLKIAAAVLAAFGVGWSVKGERAAGPVVVRETPVVSPSPILAKAPAVPALAKAPAVSASDPESDEVMAWQRAGFEMQRRERFMALNTEDGRQLAVPVNEYRVEYVGNRTY